MEDLEDVLSGGVSVRRGWLAVGDENCRDVARSHNLIVRSKDPEAIQFWSRLVVEES